MGRLQKILFSIFAIAALVWGGMAYLERTRTISGILLYQFEGSNFFEGAAPDNVREFGLRDAGWFNVPRGHPAFQNMHGSDDDSGCWKVTAFELRFVGRRRLGPSGHLSAWRSVYEVDRILVAKPIEWPDCDSPYDWD